MLKAAPAEQRPATVAFVTAEDPNTSQLEEILKRDLGALGIKTVHQSTYAADASSFDAIANNGQERGARPGRQRLDRR